MKLLVKILISVSGFTGYVLLFLTTQVTFAAQELKVGFIQGQVMIPRLNDKPSRMQK